MKLSIAPSLISAIIFSLVTLVSSPLNARECTSLVSNQPINDQQQANQACGATCQQQNLSYDGVWVKGGFGDYCRCCTKAQVCDAVLAHREVINNERAQRICTTACRRQLQASYGGSWVKASAGDYCQCCYTPN